MLDELVESKWFQLITGVFGLFGLTIPSLYRFIRSGIKLTNDENHAVASLPHNNEWIILTPRSLYHEWHINYLNCKTWTGKMLYLLFPAVPLMVFAAIINPFALEAVIIFVSFSIIMLHVFIFLFKITKATDWVLSKLTLAVSVLFSGGILFIIWAVPYWLKVSFFPSVLIYSDLTLWGKFWFPRIKSRTSK
jgi:hypothetical protein